MSWRRGTNPSVVISIKGIEVSELQSLFITFKQRDIEVEKTLDDVTLDEVNNKVEVRLTQEDTLKFNSGTVDVQARAIVKDGRTIATDIKHKPIGAILKDGVIE